MCLGIGEQYFKDQKDSGEIREAPSAKMRLQDGVSFYHYSQLGDYYCPKCGFKRPKPEFDASHIDMSDGLAFDVKASHIKANYRGFYNIYNILAVFGAAPWQESQQKTLISAWRLHSTVWTKRTVLYQWHEVMLNLAKNPAGFNQTSVQL